VSLAQRFNIPPQQIQFIDIPLDEGLLAAQAGSVDLAATGLTQRTEALKRGARVVLDMEVAGFADITGFVARKSILESRRPEIERLIALWFDCTNEFFEDPAIRAPLVLTYLEKRAATNYDADGLLKAYENEYFPRSLLEAQRELISPDGRFPLDKISKLFGRFLVQSELVATAPPPPMPIEMTSSER